MGFKNEKYLEIVYFEDAATGTGKSADDALDLVDNTAVCTVPAGTVITNCYFVVTSAISGTTDLIVGPSGDTNGLIASGTVTWATPAAYAGAGDDLKSFLYSSATDIQADFTGTCAGGAGYLVLEGFTA